MSDARADVRVPCQLSVRITLEGGRVVRATTQNVSRSGAYLVFPDAIALGSTITIQHDAILATARVVRLCWTDVSHRGVGVRFESREVGQLVLQTTVPARIAV